jgi:hypothetical protein
MSSGATGTIIASDLSSASYTDTGLTNGTIYYYSITAVNSAGGSGVSSQVSATPTSMSFGTITISGKVQYQDKIYDVNGFTGSQAYKEVRYATIDIVDSAVAPSAPPLLHSVTGTDGKYMISLPTSTTMSVYVRIDAEATLSGNTPQILIKNLSGNVYGVVSNAFTPSGSANVNISIPTTSIGGAFNLLDVFTNGFQFVFTLSGVHPPVPLNGYWQIGNLNGTYYCDPLSGGGCTLTDGIYVLNDASSGDTDEYDDDVLYHEFGHFTAAHFSKDDSPGGYHRLTDNDLDLRLAWSEGWGDFFPGAVKLWLHDTSPNLLSTAASLSLSQYVDTVGNGVGITIDMGNPIGSSYRYACNEVAVAKILLDLRSTFTMPDIWDVISSYTTSVPSAPINLELFWDRWHSLGKPVSTGSMTMQSIFDDRLITYSDLYSSGTFSAATPLALNTPQVHSLYPAGDADYVAFSAIAGQHYTITTSQLRNGADTYIELYSSTNPFTPLASNDNFNSITYSGSEVPSDNNTLSLCEPVHGPCHENGNDILGSIISFPASTAGTYYLKIYSSPTRPVSAGRYGTYTLTITP